MVDNKNLQRIDKQLFQANQDAAKAKNIKSDFLVIMSHELRTPLNAIMEYS